MCGFLTQYYTWAPGSTITIDKSDTTWLRILNKSDLTSNYIFIAGSAKIDGVKITSWDSASNHTIPQNVNGSIARPFIKADSAEGTINISNSEIAFLGNISYPDNGCSICIWWKWKYYCK